MKHLFYIIGILVLLVSCGKSNNADKYDVRLPDHYIEPRIVVSNVLQAHIGDFIQDGVGKIYKKVTDEEVLENGISKIEIWQLEVPLDNKHWYTPTLTSKIYTNDPPEFNSVFRMEGEDFPLFR